MPASRLVFAVALLLGCLSTLAAGHAQQPPKVFRIGFLGSGSPADTDPRLEAFRQRCVTSVTVTSVTSRDEP